jgi:hypothetical protein
LIPYTKVLVSYFVGLYHMSSFIPLPFTFARQDYLQGLAPSLNIVAERISNSLNLDRNLNRWLTEIFAFPHSIALVFGFTSVHFMIDHLDEADLDVLPQPPLDTDQQNASLMDHLKSMLNADGFAVSCGNEATLLGVLSPVDRKNVDLRSSTEIVSVVGLDVDHSARYEFRVTFTNVQPLALRIRDCGGAPGYVNAWDELSHISEVVQREEKMEKTSRRAREVRVVLNSAIENLVRLLYRSRSERETPGEIVHVEILDTTTEIDLTEVQ